MLAKLTEGTLRLEALYICFCVLWQNVCVAFFQPAPADHVSSSKTKRKSSLLTSLKQLVWPVNSLVSSKVTSLHELLFCLCFFSFTLYYSLWKQGDSLWNFECWNSYQLLFS